MSGKKDANLINRSVKIDLLRFLGRNNSGIILLVVLWLLVILTTLAVGLGRRTSIDLTLTKHAIGRLKARYITWGGLIYAVNQIKRDTLDKDTSKFDTFYQLAIKLEEDQIPEDIFKEVSLGEGRFTIGYKTVDVLGEGNIINYGFRDEESKININAVTQQNYKVLKNLITLFGYDEETALTIAYSAIDWKDTNSKLKNPSYGAEDEYYTERSKPYHCKNLPFDSLEELLLIKGMAPEIFTKIKDYITIFPKKTSRLLINVNTASEVVLRALGRSVAGQATNTTVDDADSLASKIIAFRRGPDDKESTPDDRKVKLDELGLNAKERSIYLASKGRMTSTSRYLRINIKGIDQASKAQSRIEAVIYRDDLAVAYFRKN